MFVYFHLTTFFSFLSKWHLQFDDIFGSFTIFVIPAKFLKFSPIITLVFVYFYLTSFFLQSSWILCKNSWHIQFDGFFFSIFVFVIVFINLRSGKKNNFAFRPTFRFFAVCRGRLPKLESRKFSTSTVFTPKSQYSYL